MRALFLALVLAGCGSLGDTGTYFGSGEVVFATGETRPFSDLFLDCPFDEGDLELLTWNAAPVQPGCLLTFETNSNWSAVYGVRTVPCAPDARGVYAVPTFGTIDVTSLPDPFNDRIIDFVDLDAAGDYRARRPDGSEEILGSWSVRFSGQERF